VSQSKLRHLPAVHALIEHPELASSVESFGREAVVQAAREVLDRVRQKTAEVGVPDMADLQAQIQRHLEHRPTLYRTVLNATGILLHTNLGRAPLPEVAWQAMEAAAGYCDLEMDLSTGKRASRLRDVEEPLTAVTGAEAGMLVNNNAAAVLISLAALAGDRPTAISRGHLVEIGGGFRLPTIMQASGSPLLEVGTTNRTHIKDYEEALETGAGLILLVHRSNFVMQGYVAEPSVQEIIARAHAHDVPVVLDLGSGALVDTESFGLPRETSVSEAVQQGFDVVCFSGDKLTGGPQAGYLVGRREHIDALRQHPLARALRCDKLQLAAAIATLELYRRGEAQRQVPIWEMLRQDTEARASAWREQLGAGTVVDATGAVGGGCLPEGRISGFALALDADDPDGLLAALRRQDPPVIGHIDKNRVLLHPRTVPPQWDAKLVAAAKVALEGTGA